MKRIIIFLLLFFAITNLFSQKKIVKFSARNLVNEVIGYNTFIGFDAADFKTTPKAFGSGLADFSGQYNLFSMWIVSPKKFPIGIMTSIGLRVAKYRFIDNYHLDISNNLFEIDTFTSHYYNDFYFSRHGSKLINGKLFLPIMFYLPVHYWFNKQKDNFGIFFGAFYDGYLFGYHKLMYEANGQLVKNTTNNTNIKKIFTKYGLGIRGGLKIFNIYVFGQYLVTPIFNDLVQKDLHEFRAGINITFDWTNYVPLPEELEKFKNDGTDAH